MAVKSATGHITDCNPYANPYTSSDGRRRCAVTRIDRQTAKKVNNISGKNKQQLLLNLRGAIFGQIRGKGRNERVFRLAGQAGVFGGALPQSGSWQAFEYA